MLKKQSFFLKSFGLAIVFFALSAFSFIDGAEECRNGQVDFDRQLFKRSQQYLDSIKNRAAALPVERQIKLERQAQGLVEKGLAKLSRPSFLVRKETFSPVDPKVLDQAFQKLGDGQPHRSLLKAAVFLNSRFYRPSELEVSVRVALPSRFYWERQFGVLAVHFPFSQSIVDLFGFVWPGCRDMMSVSSSPHGAKMWSLFLGYGEFPACFHAVDSKLPDFPVDENLLSGFPLIAQTVVLRN